MTQNEKNDALGSFPNAAFLCVSGTKGSDPCAETQDSSLK